MDHVRTFIAIELPASLQDIIQKETAGLRQGIPSMCVRWVPAHNVHLTLKFLGESSPENVETLKQILSQEAETQSPFEINFHELGAFPASNRPRIIWVGVHAPPALESLQRAIDAGVARLGYETEARPFSPHLTIGRVRQNLTAGDLQKIRNQLKEMKMRDLGSTLVESIQLFKSELQPAGSVYTKLYSAPLRGMAASPGGRF